MQDLFTRGVTTDGRLRPTHAQAPHLYKESPLGLIPKDWDFTTLSECLLGRVPKTDTVRRKSMSGLGSLH